MEELEFQNVIDYLEEDPSFPKAQIDSRHLDLQKEVVDFITSVILNHEIEFYQLVEKIFPTKLKDLLESTGPSIIQMIVETTNKFYNKIYYDIQHKNPTPLAIAILDMCKLTDYGPHILLDKLLRLTLEIHLDVIREELVVNYNSSRADNNPYDIYQKSVLTQINIKFRSHNLVHIMAKGEDEDTDFVDIPEGEYAFNIVIEKNIRQ